jgi:glycosyltransferase involved in cell wall biosynthesis
LQASPDSSAMPFISVVIPTHNGTKTLPFTLFNLAGQKYPRDRFELIVVDDRSNDDTREMVNMFISETRAAGLSVLLAQNRGAGAAEARNTGITLAQGEIIAFTDQDVFISPTWLDELAKAMSEGVAGVYGEIITDMTNFFEPLMTTSIKKKYLTACVAYRKDVLLEAGMFSPEFPFYRGDSEIAYRILEKGHRVDYAPAATIFHPLRKFLWGDLASAFRWSEYDPLLLKKHGSYATRDALPLVLPRLTPEGASLIAFILAVLAVGVLVSPLYALGTALGLVLLAVVGLGTVRSSYKGRPWASRLEAAFLSLLMYLMNILGRLVGSLKFRKFVI